MVKAAVDPKRQVEGPGAKFANRFASMLGRSVWQLWLSSLPDVMIPKALQETKQWTKDGSLRYRSVSKSWVLGRFVVHRPVKTNTDLQGLNLLLLH